MAAPAPARPTTPEPRPNARRDATVQRALHLLLLALVALHVGVLLYHAALTIAFPYDLDYGEGYVLNDALRLARGEPIYVDLQQFPMVRSPYPPLYPAVWALLTRLTGPVFWPGRLLSALALAGTCGLVAWNARRARAGTWAMVAAVGAVAASPFVYSWSAYARVDEVGLLCAVGGVLLAQWVPTWRGILGAALLCTLALWTKQTNLVAPAAVSLALFGRNPIQAFGFNLAVAVPTVIVGLGLDAATAGQFSHHVLGGNAANPVSVPRLIAYELVFLALHAILVLPALWWGVRNLRGIPSPIIYYTVGALLLSLTVGNEGSSVNYFLEPVVACALALPFVWRAVPPARAALPPLLACGYLLLLLHWPNTFGLDILGPAPHGRTPTAQDWAVGAAVDAAVRAEPGEVLAEPAGFAVRNGRPVYVQPIDLRAEQLHGRWNSQPLLDALATGRFPLVITAYELLPHDAEQVIAARFRLDQSLASDDGLTFKLFRYTP